MAPTFFRKLDRKTPNVLPVIVFLNLGLTVLVLLLSFFQGATLFSIAKQPEPALVQMVNGKSIVGQSVDWDLRTETTIHSFIEEILPLLRWESNKLPKEFAEAGENKLVKVPLLKDVLVSRINYAASFALSNGFMKAYLQSLPKLYRDHNKKDIKEVVLQISALSPPQEIRQNPRQWTVDAISTLKYFGDGNELIDMEPYNTRIHLTAVRQPKFVMEPTPAVRLVNGIRAAGLEITLIEPLKEQ